MSNARTGRRAAQEAAFTFTNSGHASERDVREAALFAGEVYQPTLMALLAILGRDDVQKKLLELGALTARRGSLPMSALGEKLLDGLDVSFPAEEAPSTLAQRAAVWRRKIDAEWTGDACAHVDRDLLGTCRRCGAYVGERAS